MWLCSGLNECQSGGCVVDSGSSHCQHHVVDNEVIVSVILAHAGGLLLDVF